VGSRRRNYLIGSSAAAIIGLTAVWLVPPRAGRVTELLLWLLIPTVAVAFSDVVADALMIEIAKPRGLTGTFQSVQWACMYGATVLTGTLGGHLSQHHRQDLGFAICAGLSVVTLALALFCVREPAPCPTTPNLRNTVGVLRRSLSAPGLMGVAAFLFLWNFNPFQNAVLYLHMTQALGFSEQFYGETVTLFALASMAACATYGLYCRRVPFRLLIHGSIALGIASTLAYALMAGPLSARIVTANVGLIYMTATLIQLDLAARICPPAVAGTVFATLMALENLAASASTALGGMLYDRGAKLWGDRGSFFALLVIGAATTAACWLLMPLLPRRSLDAASDSDHH
jgi:MFS family permease